MIRGLLVAAGLLCVGLGVLGIFLPLLPTTPFLLLAAACFARSSQSLHRWLLSRPRLGALIRDWQNHGVITKSTKVRSTLLIALTFGLAAAFARTPLWAKGAALAAILGAQVFIWTRPSAPKTAD